MISYYILGAEKRLNEIVMAGSHDAGIIYGGGNVKTQKLNILEQATAGVRLFDIRVAGNLVGNRVELKTYHGGLDTVGVKRRVTGLQVGRQHVTKSNFNILGGEWGQGLLGILDDANKFVNRNGDEFLILKFDKCKNWTQIAEVCVQQLGTNLYRGSGSLNKKTLFDLKGKVIVVFTTDGINNTPAQYTIPGGGILGIKSLRPGAVYSKTYDGMQYVGKGGSGLTTPKNKSIQDNIDKQTGRLQHGVDGDPNVMGMMYWTTTGIVGNIRERNKMMWQGRNVSEMQKLWQSCLGQSVKSRIPTCVDPSSYSGGTILKRFLPNIVMIDFASDRKCQLIYDLNSMVPTELTKMEQLTIEMKKFFG